MELRGEGLHDADVEAVHPYHRLVAWVVVPGPRRRDDEVTRVHRGALAVDRGVRARALDDEAQRRLRVAVARRNFAGKDELQPGIEALRDARLAPHPRVLQDQHAADRLLGGDQLARLHEIGRASRYFHSAGLHGVDGSFGMRLCSTSQSGARLFLSMRR